MIDMDTLLKIGFACGMLLLRMALALYLHKQCETMLDECSRTGEQTGWIPSRGRISKYTSITQVPLPCSSECGTKRSCEAIGMVRAVACSCIPAFWSSAGAIAKGSMNCALRRFTAAKSGSSRAACCCSPSGAVDTRTGMPWNSPWELMLVD